REALVDPQRGPALVKAVRERFGAALIDEFQDTDLVQYDIFRRLFHRGPLFLIGDPKQAIYRFRGADVFAYLEARSDAARRYTLERNWRSSAPLVAAVNGVFGSADRPFVLSDIPFQPAVAASAPGDRALVGDGGAPLQWQWLDREDSAERAEGKIRDAVAAEIVRLLECGLRLVDDGAEDADGGTPLEPGHIAVLVRTNAQALAFQEALRQLGVPAVVSRSGDIFRTDEAGELLRLLVAVLDPGHAAALRSACATLVWGDDASALGILDRDDVAWQRRVEQFEGYRERWRRQGFVAMVRTLVRQRGVRRRLLALEGGERRLTNLLHVVELAHEASHQRHLTPAGVVAWLRGERAAPTHDQDAAELRLESDRRAVTLTTVHKSKGLEYEVVFCPFLWQARPVAEPPVLAHLGPRHMVMDCGSDRLDHHLGLAEAERLGEDLRLAYVALTRARRRCYVAWGPIGRGSASASSALAYLLHRRQATLLDGVPGGPGGDDDARWVELGLADARARVDRWFGDLGDLVSSHGGIQSLRRLDEEPPPRRRDGDGGSQALAGVSTLQRGVLGRLKPWRIASFTSLSREAGHGEGEPTPAAADPASGETIGSTGEAPPSPPAAREIDAERPDRRDPPSVPAELAPPAGIFAFAKGPRAGDCLHDLFESCDYPAIIASPPEERSRAITEILQRHGLRKASRHPKAPPGFDPVATADGMLGRILRAPLPGAGFSLAQVTRARRLVEWQFYMPLGDLRPAQLAADLAAGASPRLRPYGRRLEGLSSQRLRGFLNGYVDLVCRHRGRYWIFDWKSNHLGNRVEDYDAEALERSMMEHHYILQYHLYSVALHRFLALRQPDYDYDRHFGGVFYVFLRGVADRPLPSPPRPPTAPARQLDLFGGDGDGTGGDPDHGEDGGAGILTGDGPTQGFFFDRPPRPLIEVLSRRFGAPSISDLTK
ncbi:MAG: 3'-5' exonuclease, partial [Acidobacteriota bacterium]